MLGSMGTRSSSECEGIVGIATVCMSGIMDNSVGTTGCCVRGGSCTMVCGGTMLGLVCSTCATFARQSDSEIASTELGPPSP